MKIQQSAEDYLETMLILEEKYGYIRSIDIAKHLGVTKPSVSYAVKRLKESGYINMESNGPITLAPPGRKIATRIYERHKALRSFLEILGVAAAELIVLGAALRRDREAGGDRHAELAHLGQVGSLSTQELAHGSIAFSGLAAETIDAFLDFEHRVWFKYYFYIEPRIYD